jgi:hypothetical protein
MVTTRHRNAVSENLKISKTSELRKYEKLFEEARQLRSHRDLIVHTYGLPKSYLKWNIIWRIVNSRLQNKLLPELEDAIEKERKPNLDHF